MVSPRKELASEQLSKPWEKLRSHRPAWWGLALFFAAYVSAGWFGQGLALIPGVSIMFWPPAGIFLAALLLTERASWPWWIFVAGAAELTCNAIWFHNPHFLAALYFGANAAEAVTGAWLIQRYGGKPFRLETLSEVAALVLFGGMLAPVVGATLIASIDAFAGKHAFSTAWPLVWLGDGSGLLVSTPMTLMAVRAWREREKIAPGKFLEAVTIGVLLTVVLALCSWGYLPTVYLALPLMLWAAVRFQLHGAPAAVALVTLLTAIFTMAGHGEFVGQPELLHAKIVMLQTFLGIAAASTLLVGALSWHRHEALERLQEINEHLEAKVVERTASLEATTRRLQLALEGSGAGFWEADSTAGEFFASARTLALFGQALDSPINYDAALALVHPGDRARVEAALRCTLDTGAPYRVEFRVPQPNGSIRWLISQADLRMEAGGQRIIGLVQDITERKEAEERLRASEQRYRRLHESLRDAFVVVDMDGHIVDCNTAYCELLDYDRDELARLTHIDLTPAKWHEFESRIVAEQILPLGSSDVYEKEYRRRDGTIIPVELRTFLIRDGASRPQMWAIVRDITERKRAQESLIVAGESFRNLVEQSPFGVYAVDADFRLVMVSAGAQKVFQNVRPLLGRDFEEVLRILWPEPFVSEALAHFRHTLATGEPYSAPSMVEQRADIGETEAYDWKIERVILPDGRPGVVCHFYDLSERQRYEALLRDTDRKKDEFLATLAHELRNPLAPIRTGLQLMKLAADDSEAVEDSRSMMERQVEQMTRLIDDLMDVSRINRGRIELRREHVELDQVVRAAVETSRPLIEEYEHTLTVSLPSRPVVLDADLARLAQVFSNLLNNAAKYMDSGGNIQLVAEQQGSDVVVSVRDAGIGIPADELPTIFDMFTQVDRALSRSRGGLGIGLGLVKKLVEMHGGTIEVHSDGPGTGSEFTVRLPMLQVVVPSNERSGDSHRQGPTSDLRILVVDDNLDAAKTTGMLLKVMGNRVQLAHDGETAVASAEKFRPHVVLCDIGLPKLNGYEVCQRIRAESWGEEMLLIAVTGWGQDNDRQIAEAAGFDQYLVKPVEPRTLMKLMADLEPAKLRTSAAGSCE